ENLGLETGALAATYGRWGDFSVSLNYDQLPHYRFNDGRTPFNGSGSTVQTLPFNWVGADSTAGFTTLSSSLKEVNIDKARQRYTGGFRWQLSEAWQLMSEFRHETKQGNETLGAIFGTDGGNPRGSIVARPVDYQTDEVTLGLSYANTRTQYNFAYSAMLFSNKDKALRFENPFNESSWSPGANFSDGAVGQMGLEPDNTSSQFSFSAGHTLGGGTRISGSAISTRLEQNDSYLPYSSVFPVSISLPKPDLDGRVDSLVVNLNLSTRLNRKTTARLRYNYRERDNKTKRDIYLRIPNDSRTQSGLISSNARINRVYDLERNRYSIDLNYRLTTGVRLSAGYKYQETDRTMVDVATTKEDSGFFRFSFKPSAISSGWVKVTRSERDASTYDSTVPFIMGHNPDYVATLVGNQIFENDPLLRRYHLADRKRDEISASLNIYPSDNMGISLLGKGSSTDYPSSVVGLEGSDDSHYAVDISYTPASAWTASIYYNHDRFSNRINGYTRLGFPFLTPFYPASVRSSGLNWTVKSEDRVNTFGGGIDWKPPGGRFDLSLDANYTDAVTKTSPVGGGGFLPIPGVITDLPFPDVTTETTSLSIKGRYQLRRGTELAIRYWYEDYGSRDWALDGVGVDTLSNVLLPGNQSPDYSGHIFLISVIFELD
ncbi:MAG: MtrB/PioB family decaheme-associated outer membrane protein, partial [Gammaproteobacteria bacterium]|nr:MtrB/PioB family decaheme-associated outer membrane protein [Gammaproteobacteria bacterium]